MGHEHSATWLGCWCRGCGMTFKRWGSSLCQDCTYLAGDTSARQWGAPTWTEHGHGAPVFVISARGKDLGASLGLAGHETVADQIRYGNMVRLEIVPPLAEQAAFDPPPRLHRTHVDALRTYVGRPTELGNRWSHSIAVAGFPPSAASREDAVLRFARWLDGHGGDDDGARARAMTAIRALAAVTQPLALVCWCAPLPCHAEVIAWHVCRLRAGMKGQVNEGQ